MDSKPNFTLRFKKKFLSNYRCYYSFKAVSDQLHSKQTVWLETDKTIIKNESNSVLTEKCKQN